MRGSSFRKALWCLVVFELVISVYTAQTYESDEDIAFTSNLPSTVNAAGRTAAETLNITNYQDNDENVYPTVFATVTIPKFLPIPFKKYADQYMRTLRAGLKGKVDIAILGLQGEDGGTGVHTRITWLEGGFSAADEFRRKIAPSQTRLAKIFPAKRWGPYVHMEAISYTCFVKKDGSDPVEGADLTPTLVIAAALEDRRPAYMKWGRIKKFREAFKLRFFLT